MTTQTAEASGRSRDAMTIEEVAERLRQQPHEPVVISRRVFDSLEAGLAAAVAERLVLVRERERSIPSETLRLRLGAAS